MKLKTTPVPNEKNNQHEDEGALTMQRGVRSRLSELKKWMIGISLLTLPLIQAQTADPAAPATGGVPMAAIVMGIVAIIAIVAVIMIIKGKSSGSGRPTTKASGSKKAAPSPLRRTAPSPISAKKPLTPPPAAFAPPPAPSSPPAVPKAALPTAPPASTHQTLAAPSMPADTAPAASMGGSMFDSNALDSALGSIFEEEASSPAAPTSAPVAQDMFNADDLDGALDDLFGSSPSTSSASPATSGMFDANNLDGALDDLFGESPAAPTAPAATQAAPAASTGLFNSSELDSDLDNLFGEDPAEPAIAAVAAPAAGMFDSNDLDGALDDLFNDGAAPTQAAPSAPAGGGMFDANSLDSDLDSLFGESPAPAATSVPTSGGMFDTNSLDSDLDSLFGGGGSAAPAPAAAPAPTSNSMFDTNDLDGALDDLFGDTSAMAPAANPLGDIENLNFDDLDTPATPFSTESIGSDFLASFKLDDSKAVPESTGPKLRHQGEGLAPMSKMLVDQSTLEDIIRRAEKLGSKGLTTTQVIMAAQGQSFDDLLSEVNEVPGMIGTLIVGNDGLVIANTMPEDIDREIVGALTSSIYLNLDVQVKQMQRGSMRRLVIKTDQGHTVLSTLEMGTLVAFSDASPSFSLNKLLAAVIAMSGRQ